MVTATASGLSLHSFHLVYSVVAELTRGSFVGVVGS